jgi:hypothetical protein
MNTPEPMNDDIDPKIQEVEIIKKEEAKKNKLMIEEKQPKNSLPIGEGHETEVIDE